MDGVLTDVVISSVLNSLVLGSLRFGRRSRTPYGLVLLRPGANARPSRRGSLELSFGLGLLLRRESIWPWQLGCIRRPALLDQFADCILIAYHWKRMSRSLTLFIVLSGGLLVGLSVRP